MANKGLLNTIAKGGGVPGSRKRRHQTKASGTKGRDKCSTCKADWRKRYFAKRSRAARDPDYPAYLIAIDREAGRKH